MKNTKGINLSRQSAKPFIHDFLLQQNYATYKQLISFKFENGCKKDPFYNMIPTFSVTYWSLVSQIVEERRSVSRACETSNYGKTCFDLAATWCRRSTIGSYALRRSRFGRPSCVNEVWGNDSAKRFNFGLMPLNWQYPCIPLRARPHAWDSPRLNNPRARGGP
jgi:hypothetical protein